MTFLKNRFIAANVKIQTMPNPNERIEGIDNFYEICLWQFKSALCAYLIELYKKFVIGKNVN